MAVKITICNHKHNQQYNDQNVTNNWERKTKKIVIKTVTTN